LLVIANTTKILQVAQPQRRLLDLPCEIKRIVMTHLGAADQTCLGLTCKNLAAILATVNLNLLGNIWWKGDKLKLMQQLRTWTPDKYRLCMRCLKYRPKARKFWIGVRSDGDFSVGRRRRWAQGIGPNICPECNDWQRGKGDPII
jgi:hypothetical protein